jgi:amidohydrolase
MTQLMAPLTEAEIAELVHWRRCLHQEPELSLEEHDTQGWLQAELAAMGAKEVRKVGGTGLALHFGRGETDRTLLIRADMDALPIDEQTGLAFASRRPGYMHACGHDGHMASLLAVTKRLIAHGDEIPGHVVVAFQPGEEGGRGAVKMIEDGLLDGTWLDGKGPKVHAAYGLHLWSPTPVGQISCAAGPTMAAVDDFTVTVRGHGGHGALPHTADDAIVAACHIVVALQSIASRRTNPLEPVVVTVGAIHGGSAFNVIAEEVVLRGTVRSFGKQLGEDLPKWLEHIAQATARAHGATADVEYKRYTVALRNDGAMADRIAHVARTTPGVTEVDRELRMMAGEDMAYFLDAVPGCFYFVGCGGPHAEPHHSPRFVVDEAALPIGANVMLRAIDDYFTA